MLMENNIKTINDIKITPKILPFRCPVCRGFGTVNYGKQDCKTCKGTGMVLINQEEENAYGKNELNE